MSHQSASAHEVAGHFFRHEGAKVVAALTAHLGAHRLQLAEDVVQERYCARCKRGRITACRTIPPRG